MQIFNGVAHSLTQDCMQCYMYTQATSVRTISKSLASLMKTTVTDASDYFCLLIPAYETEQN